MWGILAQRKQALESVLDMWSGYEFKKTACKEFLDRAERKLSDIFVGVGSAESIDKIHKEITELKVRIQLHVCLYFILSLDIVRGDSIISTQDWYTQ